MPKSHLPRSATWETVDMTTHNASKLMQGLWLSTIVSGVLALILGVIILVWPGPSIVVAAVLFGIYLAVLGIALVIFAFSLPVSAGSRILLFIGGAVSIILAVLAFRHFGDAVLLLAIWIAVGFIFRGVSAVTMAIGDPGFPSRGWTIFLGAISTIAGIVVLAWPFDSIAVLALVTGICLVTIGVIEIVSGFVMRSDIKKLEKVMDSTAP